MKHRSLAPLLTAAALLSAAGCAVTSHEVQPSPLGTPSSTAALIDSLAAPGPITLETLTSADWAVDRSGLINLDHPAAEAAGLEDGEEPIQLFFHALRHPTKGLFIVDTGVETALRDAPERAAVRGFIASAAKVERMTVHQPLGEWLAAQGEPLAGVFLTHLHLDHVLGLPDVPATTPLYAGPGETTPRALMNLFTQGTVDRVLAGKGPIHEWAYEADPSNEFEGVLDVFGDGSVWALWTPGHSPGSTAYLVRTTGGPVLLVGDVSHTRWGWEHDVEPGTFTADAARGTDSFRRIRAFAAAHPEVEVRLGHQH